MRIRKRHGIILLIAGFLVFACARGQRVTQAHEVRGFTVGTAPPPFVGVPSCSARSCHGADSPADRGRLLRNEYSIWIESDPHAAAYSVLFGARATRIMKNLATAPNASVAAQNDVRCLACHCEPHLASQAALANQRIDGVGCEACHGQARQWLDLHTASADWEKRTPAEKRQLGMNDVKDPVTVARACVGCHVGAPAEATEGTPRRDVDHDMLAAGHPRLEFEFATFMANIPAHWKQASGGDDARRRESVRPWATGQFASARAALTLLADRATRAEGANHSGTWPEFAEYDCSSCHHALTTPSSRQQRPKGARIAGRNSWGSWYLSMPGKLLAEGPGEVREFTELRNYLEGPNPAAAGAKKLVNAALIALSRIEQQTSALPNQKLISSSLDRLRRFGPPADRSNWELAEQLSLSATFLERASQTAKNPQGAGANPLGLRSKASEAVFGKLAFPPGAEGQGDFHWDQEFERELRALVGVEPKP